MSQADKVRPSEENTAIADYYLANPKLNVAIQQGGLQLGPIASHILMQYWRFEEWIKLNPGTPINKLFSARKLEQYAAFKVFVEKRIPEIAAEQGTNITDKLLDSYILTTQQRIIYATGIRPDIGDLTKDLGLTNPPAAPAPAQDDKGKKK